MTWDRTFTAHCTEGHSADKALFRCGCANVGFGEAVQQTVVFVINTSL